MQMRNAFIWHAFMALFQPLYYLYKWQFKSDYFSTASISWLTISLLFWLLIITQATIPFLNFPFRHLPAPSGEVFPLGHFWLMRDQTPPWRMQQAVRETPNDGVVAFWDLFYLRARLILTTPEAVIDVVNTHSYDWVKPNFAKRLLRRILGDGLVVVEGNQHKAMRKTVASAFSGRHIRDLAPLFWSKGLSLADAMARELAASADGHIEMMAQTSRVTLDIIGSAGIGMELNSVNGDDNKLARLYETMFGTNRGPLVLFFLINVLMPPVFVRNLFGTVYSRVARANRQLRHSIRELLAEKKEHIKLNSAGHTDIIATIMRSGEFSDEYLSDQLLTFFAAGHDTTASALTWTTWLLSLHPQIQTRLRTELQTHLSSLSSTQITAETIDSLRYLTAVCNETLRLYPTVPLTARHAVVDTQIGPHHIPKGTVALISPWLINRDTSLWGADAEAYNPNRWLDIKDKGDSHNQSATTSNGGAKNAYALMTFLYGPRSCIGKEFARLEMKCILAALVRRFAFEVVPGKSEEGEVRVGGFVTIKPVGGLWLGVRDLQGQGAKGRVGVEDQSGKEGGGREG